MPKYGKSSRRQLKTCDPRLQKLFEKVILGFDCTIIEGHRDKEKQNKAYEKGNSKLMFPKGKHNANPSMALDAIPYPIDWEDRERMTYFAGYVKGISQMLDIPIRWGGDWNNNTILSDNKFDDLVHFELKKGL